MLTKKSRFTYILIIEFEMTNKEMTMKIYWVTKCTTTGYFLFLE